jgi:hypothetical protein
MAEVTSMLHRTPLTMKVILAALGILVVACAVHFLLAITGCPSGVWKDPATGICYYLYTDAAGNRRKQRLDTCPKGC